MQWFKNDSPIRKKKNAKLELGNFCEQFGYSPLKTIAPSK